MARHRSRWSANPLKHVTMHGETPSRTRTISTRAPPVDSSIFIWSTRDGQKEERNEEEEHRHHQHGSPREDLRAQDINGAAAASCVTKKASTYTHTHVLSRVLATGRPSALLVDDAAAASISSLCFADVEDQLRRALSHRDRNKGDTCAYSSLGSGSAPGAARICGSL